jgi:PAS domain S-box-containing protein
LSDITPQKIAGQKIHKTESKYRSLFDNSLEATYLVSTTTSHFVDVNFTGAARLGYEREDIIGQPLDFINPSVDSTAHRKNVETIFNPEQSFIVETTHLHRDGSIIPVEVSSNPIVIEDQSLCLVVARDLTERKRNEDKINILNAELVVRVNALKEAEIELQSANAELELRVADRTSELVASREKFQNFAESAADRFWELDENFIVTYVSEENDRLTLPTKNMLGRTFKELHIESDFSNKNSPFEKILKSKKAFRDVRIKTGRENTNVEWIKISGVPLFDDRGKFAGYRGTTSDITNIIEAEAATLNVERQFIDAMEKLNTAYSIWDENGIFASCNDEFRRQNHNFSNVLSSGKTYNEFLFLKAQNRSEDDDASLSNEEWVKKRRDEVNSGQSDRIIHNAGFWQQVQKFRLSDGSIILLISDITTLKQAELQLHHAQKMDSLGNLAGGIAHTLNNLLLPILSLSTFELKNSPADSKSRQSIGIIAEAAKRAQEEVARILSFSRQSNREMKIVNSLEIVDNSVELIRPGLPSTVTLQKKLAANVGNVMANEMDLETVFLTHARLIRNEVDHALSELSELQGLSKGIVKIGARPSFGTVILPRAIAQLHEKRPGIRAIIREGMMSNMIIEALHGDLDFIVVTLAEQAPDEELIQETLIDSPVSIIARSGHPLSGKGPISPKALLELPWVLPLGSNPVRQRLGEMLAQSGVEDINVVVETDSVQFSLEYLRETNAVGFFPEPMILRSRNKNDFTILDVKELRWQRELGIIRRKRSSLTPAARLLMQELKDLCDVFD